LTDLSEPLFVADKVLQVTTMTATNRIAALGGALLIVVALLAGPLAGGVAAAGPETSGNMGTAD
jgi:hypothetical protein